MNINGPIYYDLTEALLSASTKRIQYYGIARTVIEIGKEIIELNSNVKLVVFSFGMNSFYEIDIQKNADGSVSFDLPPDVGQRWYRTHFEKYGLATYLFQLLHRSIQKRNVRRWEERASALKKISVLDGVFVSAARPKLIVDMIKALKESGSKTLIAPLLHDFMPLHHGATKRYRSFDRNFLIDNQFVISHSELILTNSKFTADELEHFASSNVLPKPAPVSVVQLVHECSAGLEPPAIKLPEEKYILTVGSNLGRKNIEVVIEAINELTKQGKNAPSLLIAGANRKRLTKYVDREQFNLIRNKIVFISNPNQTDLIRLYENALALAMPSRIEGWGLPAGEALWCGTPAICSTAPVLKEVCGEFGLYFDPDNASELAEIIDRLSTDTLFESELKAKIAAAKPSLRTWNMTANDLLTALN